MTSPDSNNHLQNAISDALESERLRLARQLQDTLINQVNLIQAQVNSYQATAPVQSQMAFSVLSTLIQQLSGQIYQLESTLNPTTLETMGFVVALEAFANQQRRITGANFTLNITPGMQRLPLHIELALYRFLQDTANDALKQRNSSQITLSLHSDDQHFILTILENGQFLDAESGFSSQRLKSIGANIHYGKSRYGGLETSVHLAMLSPIELTGRETEVIRLLATGLSNKEIAYQLKVKPRTIKFHLDNIYSKLNVSTRTEAAIYALQHGLTG